MIPGGQKALPRMYQNGTVPAIGARTSALDVAPAATDPCQQREGLDMAETGTIQTHAGSIAYIDSQGGAPGSLPALVIHGNSSCKEVFAAQIGGELGRRHRLIAVDLPGHGASDNAAMPARDYTLGGYAAALAAAMGGLGIGRHAVLGWSLGGHVALELLGREDNTIAAMIFGTPPVGPGAEGFGEGFLPSPHMGLTGKAELSEEEILAYAAATCGGVPPLDPMLVAAVRRTDGQARAIMVADALAGGCLNERELVETCPKLLAVVTGVDEPFVANAYLAVPAYRNLWEGRVHAIEGAGHAPFREAPAAFDVIADRFLASL